MNAHKNARTTDEGRKLLIERIAAMGLSRAAQAAGISVRTARKWRLRFEVGGDAGLFDASSRPHRTRTTLDDALLARIDRLRRDRRPMRVIARVVGRSVATVSRVLKRLGLSSLKALDRRADIVRYERAAIESKALAGNSHTSPSMITRASASCRFMPTNARTRPSHSCKTLLLITRPSVCASSAC